MKTTKDFILAFLDEAKIAHEVLLVVGFKDKEKWLTSRDGLTGPEALAKLNEMHDAGGRFIGFICHTKHPEAGHDTITPKVFKGKNAEHQMGWLREIIENRLRPKGGPPFRQIGTKTPASKPELAHLNVVAFPNVPHLPGRSIKAAHIETWSDKKPRQA